MKKKVKVTRDGSDVVMTLYLLLFFFILLSPKQKIGARSWTRDGCDLVTAKGRKVMLDLRLNTISIILRGFYIVINNLIYSIMLFYLLFKQIQFS